MVHGGNCHNVFIMLMLSRNKYCFFSDLASVHLNQLAQAQIFTPFDFPNLV
ncbi:hypothetical protein PMIT1327_00393 [Prochlorococcus marinus str. MIT 1327]|nr:hypothetical protein PMIT1312_00524 [Prochlorococcus marinus str. MIT 1312]KZR83622.1 hypothetical protein PMIT1327_00393 [Prochlorococcus marinus str. MIT 1327]